jgi:hypothetical protein
VQELGLAGDRTGAMAALPAGLIDALAVAATPATLPDRVAEYEATGITTLLASVAGANKAETLRQLARLRHG